MKKSDHLLTQGKVFPQIVPYFQSKTPLQTIKLNLSYFWSSLISSLYRVPEPKVKKKFNHRGEISWQVYDPYTNTATEFSSEAEVRMWLDQRHYQK